MMELLIPCFENLIKIMGTFQSITWRRPAFVRHECAAPYVEAPGVHLSQRLLDAPSGFKIDVGRVLGQIVDRWVICEA